MIVVICIFVSVLANVQGTMFMKTLIDQYITPLLKADTPDFGPLTAAIARVACFYAIGVIATYTYNRIMINVSQGTLRNLRNDMFAKMETLPIKYFDTHAHGDIMSIYTNDIDTLRQMISQSFPTAAFQCDHHCQCSCKYADPQRSAYFRDSAYGCHYADCQPETCGPERKIFPGTADKPWYCQRLYRRDDGRTESCQSLLP